jgi:hypothetical protein
MPFDCNRADQLSLDSFYLNIAKRSLLNVRILKALYKKYSDIKITNQKAIYEKKST